MYSERRLCIFIDAHHETGTVATVLRSGGLGKLRNFESSLFFFFCQKEYFIET